MYFAYFHSFVFIYEIYTRIFVSFRILLSKCPSILGKMTYVSLNKLPLILRNRLYMLSKSGISPQRKFGSLKIRFWRGDPPQLVLWSDKRLELQSSLEGPIWQLSDDPYHCHTQSVSWHNCQAQSQLQFNWTEIALISTFPHPIHRLRNFSHPIHRLRNPPPPPQGKYRRGHFNFVGPSLNVDKWSSDISPCNICPCNICPCNIYPCNNCSAWA